MSGTILQEGQQQKDLAGKPATATQTRVRLRAVALPTEHGGWGLALEPVIARTCPAL